MDTKKVIAKLIKIAESQQKIINKLAQNLEPAPTSIPTGGASSSWSDAKDEVAPVVQQATQAVQAKGQYGVQSAESSPSGLLRLKLQFPSKLMGSPEYRAVKSKIQELLTGKAIAGNTVQNVEVIGVTV